MISLRPVLYRLRQLFIIFPSTWYQMIGIETTSHSLKPHLGKRYPFGGNTAFFLFKSVFLEAYFPFLIMSDADIPSPIRIFKNTL